METKKTNKELLVKGLKTMGIALVFMFLGPTFVYIAFSNSEKLLYIPILILGFTICILAVFFSFKGLQTIMSSLFD